MRDRRDAFGILAIVCNPTMNRRTSDVTASHGDGGRYVPIPAHPTQAWATEGATPDGNRGPNGGRPRRCAPLPPPTAAPGPPFPQSFGNRLPARRRARPPPPTLAGSHTSRSPGDDEPYTFSEGREKRSTRCKGRALGCDYQNSASQPKIEDHTLHRSRLLGRQCDFACAV